MRPFRRQHPIRGFFGDPRTVGLERLGFDKAGSLGSFAFHNGIDITAAPGTPVYPVVSGIAHVGTRDRISVTTGDGRTFQYFHLERAVRPGEPVIAHRTVLGTVKPIWNHLHLTEIDAFKAHNPLDPGHLEPYRDRTVPTIDRVSFTSSSGLELDPSRLHGVIEIVADAEDLPPLPVPGHWLGFPVAPALVTWRLTSTHGRTLLRGVAADFRHTEPPPSDFWHVYAAGTYQNYPDFTHHLYWHVPGRYLFNLTQSSLDTRRFRNGTYLVSVGAADTCGNRSILTEQIRIDNQRSRLRSNAQQLTSASQP